MRRDDTRPVPSAGALRAAGRIAYAGAFSAALIAIAVFIGWRWNIDVLKRGHAGLPTMVPNTAVAILVSSAALVLLARGADGARRVAGRALAATALLLGLATLVEYATGLDLRVDRLLFGGGEAPAGFLGRPAMNTAFGATALGLALLSIDARPWRRRVHPAELFAALVVLTALPTLVGYVFSVVGQDASPRVPRPLVMALPTSIALVLLPIGIFAARPSRGVMALATMENAGGVAARRMIVGAVAIPALGLFLVTGAHAGLYDGSIAAALLATAGFVFAVGLALSTAASLEAADAVRRKRESELRESRSALQRSDERSRALAEWLKAVLDQMPEGVVLIRSDGSLELNRAALRFAHPPTDAKDPFGNPVIFDILRPDGEPFPVTELPILRALERGVRVAAEELQIRTTDGSLVPIVASAAPVRDAAGLVVGAVAAFRDISALKELERMREEWTSVVAHDLRQPVGVIALHAQVLARRAAQLDEPTQRAVARIGKAGKNLDRMIGDLLDASRIEARRMTLELVETDVSELVREIVERQTHATAGHEVEVREPSPVGRARVDPGRIEQIVGNLLSNGAKYGAPDGRLIVELARDVETDEIVVSVTNEGGGIAADELKLLFSRFQRVKGTKAPGLGLGLYIVKGLVEAHGGRISAESVVGATTTFRFTLPAVALREALGRAGMSA